MKITDAFQKARPASIIVIVTSAAALGGAYGSQYLGGLQPCTLCLYQRIPHLICIVLGLFALFFAQKSPKPAAFIIAMTAIVYLIGAILAFYHAGVEQHWWVSAFEGCSNPMLSGGGDLLKQIEHSAAVRCDAVAWQMFGISMAGYNGLLCLIMSVFTLSAAVLITRRANGL